MCFFSRHILRSNYPLNILAAEDNLINQKLVVKILRKLGYNPEMANRENEILEQLDEKIMM